MNKYLVALTALMMTGTANAEVVSLICEHDSGVNIETGKPNRGYTEIFRIDFDTNKNRVVTPFFATLDIDFSVTDYSVAWRFKLPADGETYVYQLNRATGTLFVDIATPSVNIVAKGQCGKIKRIL